VLDVLLDIALRELATNQTLDIPDGVGRVGGSLVLGCVSDQTLVLGEGDVGWGDTVSWEGR